MVVPPSRVIVPSRFSLAPFGIACTRDLWYHPFGVATSSALGATASWPEIRRASEEDVVALPLLHEPNADTTLPRTLASDM
jgi:hypothetical protein